MADNDVRRARLKWLLTNERENYQTGMAADLECSTSQLGQWLSGHRGISDRTARRIEATYKKPDYWLDGKGDAKARELSPLAVRLARAFDLIVDPQVQYQQYAELTQRIEDAANAHAPSAVPPGHAPRRRQATKK